MVHESSVGRPVPAPWRSVERCQIRAGNGQHPTGRLAAASAPAQGRAPHQGERDGRHDRDDDGWVGPGPRQGRHRPVRGDPLRRPTHRSPALPSARAGRALGRHPRRHPIRSGVLAVRPGPRRPAGRSPARLRRGLPQPERRHPRRRRPSPTGDGLDPRRRLRRWQRIDPLVQRDVVRTPRRRRRRHHQLPTRRPRLPAPRRGRRRGVRLLGPVGHPRSGRSAALGARQHRRLRWRSRQRHHLRRVGRRDERGHAARTARGVRAVPSRHRPERRRQQPDRPGGRGTGHRSRDVLARDQRSRGPARSRSGEDPRRSDEGRRRDGRSPRPLRPDRPPHGRTAVPTRHRRHPPAPIAARRGGRRRRRRRGPDGRHQRGRVEPVRHDEPRPERRRRDRPGRRPSRRPRHRGAGRLSPLAARRVAGPGVVGDHDRLGLPAAGHQPARGPGRQPSEQHLRLLVHVGHPGLRRPVGFVPRPRDPVRVQHAGPARGGPVAGRRRARVAGPDHAGRLGGLRPHRRSQPRRARPEWPAYDSARRATMEFGDRVGVLDDPGAAEREVWGS